jgi:hypothetical protein
MDFSLNPMELIKLYSENKYLKKENITEYLKKTAVEASIIADIWEKVVIELNTNNQISNGLVENIKTEIGAKYFFCNNKPYTRLTHFYRLTSSAISDKVNNHLLDTIISSIGTVLRDRKLTKNKFEELLNNKLNSKSSNQIIINDMVKIVENLRKNAEYLSVLAETIKLKKLN